MNSERSKCETWKCRTFRKSFAYSLLTSSSRAALLVVNSIVCATKLGNALQPTETDMQQYFNIFGANFSKEYVFSSGNNHFKTLSLNIKQWIFLKSDTMMDKQANESNLYQGKGAIMFQWIEEWGTIYDGLAFN